MPHAIAVPFLLLTLLFGFADSASARAMLGSENRVGVFGENTNIDTYQINPFALETPRVESQWHYDVALGVTHGPNLYTYVNQNPWTFFDPVGLYLEVTEKQQAPMKKFFGEDNIKFKNTEEGNYRVELGDGAIEHLNAYDGDKLYKGILGAAAANSDQAFTLEDTQKLWSGIKSAKQTKKEMEMVRVNMFETKYVEDADAYYKEMIRTQGWSGQENVGADLMEAYMVGMAEMIALGAAGEALAIGAARVSPLVREWLPSFKPIKGPGGVDDGWTLSQGSGYGSKPRVDYHTFPSEPSKGAKGLPKRVQGKRTLHYHRRGAGGIGQHRPWQKKQSWKWWQVWKRF